MSKVCKIKITVKSVEGECPQGFKVGDAWTVENKTPGGMCMGAYNSMSAVIGVLRFGGELPWEKDKNVACVACPDSKNPVVYEVRRIEA